MDQADQAKPGESYGTGRTISGQHCGKCGQPDATRDRTHYRSTESGLLMGETETVPTPCCGILPCHGYVTTTPWVGRRTGRETWACCLGVAEGALGEPVVNRLRTGGEAPGAQTSAG